MPEADEVKVALIPTDGKSEEPSPQTNMRTSTTRVTVLKALFVLLAIALVTTGVVWVTHTATWVEPHHENVEMLVPGIPTEEGVEIIDISGGTSSKKTADPAEVKRYKSEVLKAQKAAIDVLDSTSGWSKVAGDSAEGKGIVYKKHTKQWGNTFKLLGTVNKNTKVVYDDMITQSEAVPNWNPSLLKVRVLKSLDNSTEIAYNVAASGGGGMISSRDFVYVRHWEKIGDWYTVSSVSVNYPPVPPNSQYTRGLQKPTVIRMKEINPNKMSIQWLLNIDLKGNLFHWLVDNALPGTMVDYLENLRKHVAKL